MPTYVFSPETTNQQVSWDDPTVWSGGVVPEGAAADVVLGAHTPAYTIAIASGEDDEVGSLNDDGQQLVLAGALTTDASLSLQNGAAAVLEGGHLSAGSVTADDTSAITGNGTITGPVVDNGTITADTLGGYDTQLTIEGPVTGDGTLLIAGDPLLGSRDVNFFEESSALELEDAASVNIRFGNASGFLELDDPQEFTGTITLAATQDGPASDQSSSPPYLGEDDILLGGVSMSNVTGVTYDGGATGGVLTVAAGSQTVTLHVASDLSQDAIETYGFETLPNGEPSVILHITPDVVPTLSLDTPDGGVPFAIVNTAFPRVSGTATSGTTVDLTADGGSNQEGFGYSYAAPGQPIGSFDTALNGLTLGLHEVDALALTDVGNLFAAAPVDVFVLPDPVEGITTATVSSFQLGSYVDRGASMNFVAGTEAIRLTDGTLSVGADTVQASVQRLYEGLLGRAGDTGGLVQFTSLATACGTGAVASAILGSTEFQQLHGTLSDTQFVTVLYNGLLGRTPDAGGLALYEGALGAGASRGQIAAGIADSAEAKAHLAASTANVWVPDPTGATVTEFYQTAFGHAPDLGGLGLFSTALQGGLSVQQLAQQLAASPEFLADHAGQGTTALVTSLYENGLGRRPSAADLQHWSGASSATILLGVAASPEAGVHLIRDV